MKDRFFIYPMRTAICIVGCVLFCLMILSTQTAEADERTFSLLEFKDIVNKIDLVKKDEFDLIVVASNIQNKSTRYITLIENLPGSAELALIGQDLAASSIPNTQSIDDCFSTRSEFYRSTAVRPEFGSTFLRPEFATYLVVTKSEYQHHAENKNTRSRVTSIFYRLSHDQDENGLNSQFHFVMSFQATFDGNMCDASDISGIQSNILSILTERGA